MAQTSGVPLYANGNLSDLPNVALALTNLGITSTTIATATALGSTQGTALAIPALYTIFTTVGTGTGTILPAAMGTTVYRVLNRGANALLVYPPTGAQIEALGANVGFSVAAAGVSLFIATSATQLYAFV